MQDETVPVPESAGMVPPAPAPVDHGDGFHRDRLLDIVDGLERDIALVEGAMNDIENGDHAGVDAALAALGGR